MEEARACAISLGSVPLKSTMLRAWKALQGLNWQVAAAALGEVYQKVEQAALASSNQYLARRQEATPGGAVPHKSPPAPQHQPL